MEVLKIFKFFFLKNKNYFRIYLGCELYDGKLSRTVLRAVLSDPYSLLGACLIIQILTGVFLAMHYCPNVDLAFTSVEHIMRDVNSGWFLRYTHANVASFFFLFLYFHTARGLYYSSYKTPRVAVWTIGVIILILTMAIGFLGYFYGPTWFKQIKIIYTVVSLFSYGRK